MPIQKKIPQSTTLVVFYLLAISQKKRKEMKAMSIMSSRTVVLATKGSWQRYRCLTNNSKYEKKQLSENKLCMVRGSSANVPKAQGQKTGLCLHPVRLTAGLKYCFYWRFEVVPFFFFPEIKCAGVRKAFASSHLWFHSQ